MVVGIAVVHETPQLLESLGTLCAPPEPAATCLVQRAPENGDACSIHLFQISRNLVHVLHHPLVFITRGVSNLAAVYGGLTIICAWRTGEAGAVVHRHPPVPHTSHKATVTPPTAYNGDVAVIKPAIGIHVLRSIEMDKVENVESRVLACPFIDVLGFVDVPIDISHRTGYHLFAIYFLQHVQHNLRIFAQLYAMRENVKTYESLFGSNCSKVNITFVLRKCTADRHCREAGALTFIVAQDEDIIFCRKTINRIDTCAARYTM